jgi:Na+-transporting NADH:ubiquinone oxidoreductase subunit NqrF
MGRRKKTTEPSNPTPNPTAHWITSSEIVIHGRHVKQGSELSIKGERGRFNFIKHVLNPKTGSEWVDVVGGAAGYKTLRSFHVDKIRRVHSKAKTKAGRKAKGLDVE